MQSANIQLSLAVKSASPSNAGAPVLGPISQSDGSSGFDRWMAEAANRPAQIDRSKSKPLPSGGDELPASESVSQNRSDDIKPDSDLQSTSSTEVVARPASESEQGMRSDTVDRTAENYTEGQTVDSAVSGSQEKALQTAESNSDPESENPQEISAVDASGKGGNPSPSESVVEIAVNDASPTAEDAANTASTAEVGDAQDSGEEALRQEQSSSLQTAAEAQNDEASISVGQEKLADKNHPEQPASNLSAEILNRQADASQSRDPSLLAEEVLEQTERKTWQTPPPGAEYASEQGIANGRPFETVRADTDISGDTLQTNQSGEPEISLPPVAAVAEESGSGELSPSVVGVMVQSASESQGASETPQSAGTISSSFVEDIPADSDTVAENQVPLAESEAIPDSSVAPISTAEIARATDTKPSVSTFGGGTQASAAVANANANANQSVSGVGGAGTQQSGADTQSNRQAFSDQLAQMGAAERATDKASETRAQSASAESQASIAKTGAPTTVPLDASARAPLTQAQTTAAAVPPQALNRMQQAQWGQKLGERSLMMVQHGPRVAYVQLDPPELGALQVRVHLHQGDQVSLSFSAPNAAVKEAIEQHLPRLREMFADQGLNLTQSDVRDQSAGGRDRGDQEEAGHRRRFADSTEESEMMFTEMSVPVGAVDYYA